MSEFHDPDLRQQLGDLSGPYPDDNAAFAAWQRRVGQARRRRAVGWMTGAAMSLIVGTVAVAALQRPTGHSLVPSQSSETTAEPTTAAPTTEACETSTIESTTTVSSAPTTTLPPETTPSTVVETLPVPPAPADTPASGGAGNGGSTGGGSGSPTSPPNDPQSTTETFSSGGGSITVRLDGSHLTVVGNDPAPGFRARENNRSGRKVEVTFRSKDQEFEITVRLVDGVMQHTVSEDSDDHESTVPDDSSGGGRGGSGGGNGGYGGYGGGG